MFKQIIIARKDLNMTPGKLAAQVAHGSLLAVLPNINDEDIINNWIKESYTKVVLGAKNRNQLLKAKTIAEDLGLRERVDFVLVYDECRTELEREDDKGTLTVIGFKPMNVDIADKIGKKFQMF